MPLINYDTGSVNLRKGSAKFILWHAPRTGVASQEKYLGAAARDPSCVEVQSRSGWTNPRPSLLDLMPDGSTRPVSIEVGGSMKAETVEIANGGIIKVFAKVHAPWSADANPVALRSHATQLGLTAMQYYRVREGAAVVTLKIKMLNDPRCPYPFATVTGPLEPLTLDEAITAGVAPPLPQYRRFYHPALTDWLITSETLQRATTTMQTVQTEAGPVEVVQAAGRRRELRKRSTLFSDPV